MQDTIEQIRKVAETILSDKTVEMVIGFRRGTIPLMNEPLRITRPEEVPRLVWDSHCGINLANYLAGRREKIGIIAKGCDSRNIVMHIIENKIKREQLHIIGVPCRGMVDRRKIAAAFAAEIEDIKEAEDQLTVCARGSEMVFDKIKVLQDNCRICTHRNPVIFDTLIGDPVEEQTGVDRYEDIRQIEDMPPVDKYRYFDDLLSVCIRCYACRNACPLCYCPTCFVDESRPQWVGKSQDPADVKTFHFLRAYHCAGRCTDCGACERVCPVDIKVRQLTKKLEKDCLELFQWEAGLSVDERPPLDTYKPEDPDEFIK